MIRRAAECVLVIVVVVYLDLFMSTPFLFRAAHYGPRRCSPPKAAAAAAAKAAASLKAVDRLHTFATLTVVVVVFVFEPMKKSHFESLHLSRCCLNQCDQTGQFFKVLGDMVSVKSSPNTWWFIWLKWTATLFMLNCCSYSFGQLFEKFGLLFNFASGHSGLNFIRSNTLLCQSCLPMMEVEKNPLFFSLPPI